MIFLTSTDNENLSFCSFLNDLLLGVFWDQALYPYKTTEKILILCTLICTFDDDTQVTESSCSKHSTNLIYSIFLSELQCPCNIFSFQTLILILQSPCSLMLTLQMWCCTDKGTHSAAFCTPRILNISHSNRDVLKDSVAIPAVWFLWGLGVSFQLLFPTRVLQ
jgi:hypothetical protein